MWASFSSSFIFQEDLCRTDISFLNVWYNLLVKSSKTGISYMEWFLTTNLLCLTIIGLLSFSFSLWISIDSMRPSEICPFHLRFSMNWHKKAVTLQRPSRLRKWTWHFSFFIKQPKLSSSYTDMIILKYIQKGVELISQMILFSETVLTFKIK